MITVQTVALDSLPAELQAFFMGAAAHKSSAAPALVCSDMPEQESAHKPDMGEENDVLHAFYTGLASRKSSEQKPAPAPALRCADVIEGLDAIEVHELAVETIDLDRFALDLGDW